MKVSELIRFCAGGFTLAPVFSELKEVIKSRSRDELKEELGDLVTTASLWFYEKTGVDYELPSWASQEKYVRRTEDCRLLLISEGLFDAARAKEDSVYWRRYTAEGSNLERPHKKRIFLEHARADQKANKR